MSSLEQIQTLKAMQSILLKNIPINYFIKQGKLAKKSKGTFMGDRGGAPF